MRAGFCLLLQGYASLCDRRISIAFARRRRLRCSLRFFVVEDIRESFLELGIAISQARELCPHPRDLVFRDGDGRARCAS